MHKDGDAPLLCTRSGVVKETDPCRGAPPGGSARRSKGGEGVVGEVAGGIGSLSALEHFGALGDGPLERVHRSRSGVQSGHCALSFHR